MKNLFLSISIFATTVCLLTGTSAGAQALKEVEELRKADSLSLRPGGDTLSAGQSPAAIQADPQVFVVHDTVYVEYDRKRDRKFSSYVKDKKFLFAIRTNALAVPLINIGMEFPFGNHWSVGFDYYYPFIKRNTLHKDCFEFIGYDLDVRYYLGSDRYPSESRLLGHSFGIYGAGGHYDFEREWSGHQGTFFNIGFDWKYSWPVFHGRMHMEIELGLGLIYSDAQPYDVFIPYGDCFRRPEERKIIRWYGPTRAQFNIVVPIYRKPMVARVRRRNK